MLDVAAFYLAVLHLPHDIVLRISNIGNCSVSYEGISFESSDACCVLQNMNIIE